MYGDGSRSRVVQSLPRGGVQEHGVMLSGAPEGHAPHRIGQSAAPGAGADVSSLDWVETRIRPRASNAPSQARDRGGGSALP